MLENIILWSLRYRSVMAVAAVLLVLVGVDAARKLPIDALPDIMNVQVQVIATAPALGPAQMELYVTAPLERALSGTPRVTDIRSMSKYGFAFVTVVFRDDTDLLQARQLVGERLSAVRSLLPPGSGDIELAPITTGLGEIFHFMVVNSDPEKHPKSMMELKEVLDWGIAPELRQVPGIVEVNSLGHDKQYQVVLDPARLQSTGVTAGEVVEALEKANANAGGGYVERDKEHVIVGSEGLLTSLDDLRNVVVGARPDGTPIVLSQLGDPIVGPRLRRGAATLDGKGEVVVGVALMLRGENARVVTGAVKARLESIAAALPPGVSVEPFYDRSVLVDRTIKTAVTNLVEGAGLVLLMLFLMLGSLRAGLCVAVAIPLSMLFALVVMTWRGMSGNLMSLGAIDFGLIVDGAIIVVENAVRRIHDRGKQEGRALTPEERTLVIGESTIEVWRASFFGMAIIAIVYVPILSLQGVEEKLFSPMAWTVLYALAGAGVLSLTLIPVLASFILPLRIDHHETRIFGVASRAYEPVLRAALRFPVVVSLIAIGVLGGALYVFSRTGAEFVPDLDEGDLLIEVRRLPSIAIQESIQTDMRISRALLDRIPEVHRVITKVGSPEIAMEPMGLESSDHWLGIRPREQWREGLTRAELASQIMRVVEEVAPEVAGGISQPVQMRNNELLAGVRSDVVAEIYGDDLFDLQRLGSLVATAVKQVSGAEDVRIEQSGGAQYLRIKPDRARLARFGLNIADVNELTEMIAAGHEVGLIFEGQRRFSLVVKLKTDADVEALRRLPLFGRNGKAVPLNEVASVELEEGPSGVNRRGGSRRLNVEFNVRGRDMLSVVDDAQRAVSAHVKLPAGYRVKWGGTFEHYEVARDRLSIVVPLVLMLILFMLWTAFHNLPRAFIVFLNVPLATTGGIFALALTGIPFSISAGVGFIALFGVAMLNGLVMISFAQQLEATGSRPLEAITEAARVRLRPILMTAVIPALGLVPMAISTAPGAEVQRPLATVIIGGLVTATALSVVVLPAVYRLAFSRGAKDEDVEAGA